MNNIYIKDGTSQRDRKFRDVESDYVALDERSFEDIINYMYDYAGLVKFHDQTMEVKGDWRELFASNEIVILALFIKFDLKGLEINFKRTLNLKENSKKDYFRKLIDQILGVALRINKIYLRFLPISAFESKNFKSEIEGIIATKLALEIKTLKAYMEFYGLGNNVFEEFDVIWNLQTESSNNGNIDVNDVQETKNKLKALFYSFYNAISYLQKIAPSFLEKSLKAQNHKPDSALFLAFVNLLGKVRNKVNTFTQRHTDFFYNDILKIESRSYVPDSTYLLLELAPKIDSAFLPAGTKFLGGKDENKKDLIYTNKKGFLVNNTKVKKLFTLSYNHDEMIAPTNYISAVTSIVSSEIPVLGNEDPVINSWTIFGKTKKQEAKQTTFRDVGLGFAIASPCLYLKEGNANVRIKLRFGEKNSLPKKLKSIAKQIKVSEKEIFATTFSNAFNMQLTTADGWFCVDNYMISSDFLESIDSFKELTIIFKLSASSPEITNYNQAIHKGKYDCIAPLVQITLNPHANIYAYSFLSDLKLNSLAIEADVEGIKDLQVYSNMGRLDISAPYNPFGVMPIKKSNFVIGNYEVFQKNIKSLDLKIEWADLPEDEHGFSSYYENYDLPFSNSCFKINLSLLKNGNWIPFNINGLTKFNLFSFSTFDGMEGKLNDFRKLLKISSEQFRPFTGRLEEYYYSINTQNGFMKVELTNPDFAFGHKQYPFVLNNIAIRNARRRKKKKMPNQPYTPLVKKMELNYRANSVLNFSAKNEGGLKEAFYHIHPFGIEKINPSEKNEGVELIPSSKNNGNLLIGLDNIKPNRTVSLYFQFDEDSALEKQTEVPKITWSYLSGNTWKEFGNTRVTEDSTNGFLNTGIVTLEMPEYISSNNSILPEGIYWVMASANENLDSVCSLEKLCTQVIKVSWENNQNEMSHLHDGIPAETISKTTMKIPGMAAVYQPINSSGGRALEGKAELKNRMSGRLRHKNRATTALDYELIILENFPNIQKVKCFMNMSSSKVIHPGNILLVVTPKVTDEIDDEPMISTSCLNKIKELLANFSSPFASIEVRNPVYERVFVRCAVKLKEGLEGGYFLNKLNNDLVDYFNPWKSKLGKDAKGPVFGAAIRNSDVLGYIQNQEYVELVTNFSLLKVNNAENKFKLFDSAEYNQLELFSEKINTNKDLAVQINPSTPWSVMISAKQHNIKHHYSNNLMEPSSSGINDLELGESFIVQ